MMKFFKKLLILCTILLFGLYIYSSYDVDAFSNNLTSVFDKLLAKTNNSNLLDITGLGDLINDSDVKSLEDSGISGNDIAVNATYYPYYDMLNNNEKSIYKQIYANVNKLESTFVPIVDINSNELKRAFMSVFYDHPEFFWLNTEYSYKYTKNGKCVQIIVSFNDTVKNINDSKNKFENAANKIINEANRYNNNYEKEKYVHNAIINNTSYDVNSSLNQSAYSAIVNKSSVCAGYARAFQYIMIKLGIPTYYVVGVAKEEHAWNIVALDDGYYNVDVTWDDQNKVIYNYFNRTDKEFASSHVRRDLSVSLPSCTAIKYNGKKESTSNTVRKIIKKYKKIIPNITIDNNNNSVNSNNNNNNDNSKNNVDNYKDNSTIVNDNVNDNNKNERDNLEDSSSNLDNYTTNQEQEEVTNEDVDN